MKEVKYMISDTAKKVDVEAHVLRYWEEELELKIGRNEMGHRYYTPDNIVLFKNIKELKEQGFQLKAIKMLLPELNKQTNVDHLLLLKEELNFKVSAMNPESMHESTNIENETQVISAGDHYADIQEEKVAQFQEILKNAVKIALEENNQDLSKEVSVEVSEKVLKEMDYVVRMKEEREEERFKKLDETLRTLQQTRQEIAITNKENKKLKKEHKSLFRKNKKIAQ